MTNQTTGSVLGIKIIQAIDLYNCIFEEEREDQEGNELGQSGIENLFIDFDHKQGTFVVCADDRFGSGDYGLKVVGVGPTPEAATDGLISNLQAVADSLNVKVKLWTP